MKPFATLLHALSLEPGRNGKRRLIAGYLASQPDPARGFALAALCGALDFPLAKPALLRSLVSTRVDPVLFAHSYDFVGDLSETIALIWPAPPQPDAERAVPDLPAVIAALSSLNRTALGAQLETWLDQLDETGRWALLKLVTGGLRVGVSTLLARQAVADVSGKPIEAIEEIWHALAPPYRPLFDWLEGRSALPDLADRAVFRSPMLAHPLDEADLPALAATDFAAEWKWDGIRVQAVVQERAGARQARLFSRTGDEISPAFPDLMEALAFDAVIDGELVIARDGQVSTFSDLQQRLNRKSVTPAMRQEYPAHLMAYDLLFVGGEDLRSLAFDDRRARLEALVAAHSSPRLLLSPLIPVSDWSALAAQRAASAADPAIEGIMLKRRASPYLAGRPKGLWFKWKREPMLVDCVMMYAQRGHGKRSSLYSDFTFGVWDQDRLVPVGKAYFGFTDAELRDLDRFVRQNTINRFGPVREVIHEPARGLVLEIAFEGLQESGRHKSGIAMRFPRINRIRTDKLPGEADRIEALRALLERSRPAP